MEREPQPKPKGISADFKQLTIPLWNGETETIMVRDFKVHYRNDCFENKTDLGYLDENELAKWMVK